MHREPRRIPAPHPVPSLLVALCLSAAVSAQAPRPAAELIAVGARSLETVELLSLPPVDNQALLAADAAAAGPGVPLRFAEPLAVFHTPRTSGTWETLADGSRLWRLRVRSPGAVSLNFAFTRYAMPKGGTLLVYAADGSTVFGPFTERHNKSHGQLWTPLVPGEEAVIEARLPAGREDGLALELTAVNHGYRDIARAEKSGACNIDVVCPEGGPWEPQIRSVARIVIGGFNLCTGFMVNNTAEDLRPLFMTADHCDLGPGNAPSLVVYWDYFNSTCRPPGSGASGGPGDGSLSLVQTGATYLAGSSVSDFTLLELDDPPPAAANVHWAGWDARPVDPPAVVTIHHPSGDEKRISFENEPVTTTSYLDSAVPGDGTHIRVADWDQGTTEPGSSGGPLFSPEGRVIGQLHGGFAACGNDLPDWYGRFSVSWDLGLWQWLDPCFTCTLVLDGRDGVAGGGCGDGGGNDCGYGGGECRIGPALGSTLLVPYFEVDLANPGGATTILSINNGKDDPALVRVVLWTDWGVPTLAFDAYLEGFDVLPINVRSIFDGDVPSTGEGADLSGFPFCGTPGFQPFHPNPTLTAAERAQLAADHTGQPGPLFGDCAGEPHDDQIARGYITADVIDECNGLESADDATPEVLRFTPADPDDWPYFAEGGGSEGIAIVDDRLWGDVVYVDFTENSAQGSEAVAIWADPVRFAGPGVFTFYGRFSGWDGRDERVPLSSLWSQRFLNGGPFAGGADLIVFRDTGVPVELAACGEAPSWWPLGDFTVARDEEAENLVEIGRGQTVPIPVFPEATQRVDVNSLAIPYPFGVLRIDTAPWGAWVQPTLKAGGLFSAAYNGAPERSLCDQSPPAEMSTAAPAAAKRRTRVAGRGPKAGAERSREVLRKPRPISSPRD